MSGYLKREKKYIDTFHCSNNITNLDEIMEFLKNNIERSLLQNIDDYYISVKADPNSHGAINIDIYCYDK